ncbi:hypothetical protein GCM10023114_05960 [Mycolicibacterium sediminis]|uniref:Uncharacterized protein n=1 Tax=Mycolicibacterium sediminis TaxID=1286180 RepID=A0A7I7QZG5_9MYCO|nr:hypothetical protein MSEDJ_58850 [Mycolicibacterium sediminis]
MPALGGGEFPENAGPPCFIPTGDRDYCPVLDRQFRGFPADARRGAGDQDLLSIQIHREFPFRAVWLVAEEFAPKSPRIDSACGVGAARSMAASACDAM